MASGWEDYWEAKQLAPDLVKEFRYKPQNQLRKLFKTEKESPDQGLPINITVPLLPKFQQEYDELTNDLQNANVPFHNEDDRCASL